MPLEPVEIGNRPTFDNEIFTGKVNVVIAVGIGLAEDQCTAFPDV